MLVHDSSLLVFVGIALVVGFCLGVLFWHELGVWRLRRSLRPRRLKLPKQPKPNRRRSAELKVVR